MKLVRERFAYPAAALASAVAGQAVESWSPGFRLTQKAEWFSAPTGRLVVVVGDHERPRDVDSILGYVLGVVGNVAADLVLPSGRERATLRRLRFLTYPIRVWTHGDGDVVEAVVPTQEEVLSRYDGLLVLDQHHLGDKATWVTTLMAWADSELDPAHRPTYLSWHYQGRNMLRIRRTGSRLSVEAGAQHKNAADRDLPVSIEIRLETNISDLQEQQLRAAIEQAMANRRSGHDDANMEHRFQASLAAARQKLGYQKLRREFPAERTGRGYIDFLAKSDTGRLIVVETKRGGDPQLVLQGLDYWIWATAHKEKLADIFDTDPEKRVQIDYVLDAAVLPIVGPYTAAQVEALKESIPWRFRAIDWEGTDNPTVVDLGLRQSPGPGATRPFDAPDRRPPRYR